MAADDPQPVLILGAGINGCAVARELALNGVPVRIVEAYDVAAGATSRSSRLIHGGLRYLEYADFDLVRESLAERNRLLELAPQFVEPLRLYIPVRKRTGGFLAAGVRFAGLSRTRLGRRLSRWLPASDRGLWSIRIGLSLYDRLAGHDRLPPHRVYRLPAETPPQEVAAPVGSNRTASCAVSSFAAPAGLDEPARLPRVDPSKYHWLCAYSDAQMLYPERFVLAMLEDARAAARERNADFQVRTYHRAVLRDGWAEIQDSGGELVERFQPAAVVNATGAWGDKTLKDLGLTARPLFGGTKGSHLVTWHPGLREAIGPSGVYAETPDGRLVFVLPFGEAVLVGTTDEVFADDPIAAVASEHELDYLAGLINEVFPGIGFTMQDVGMHYSGVRPLPAMTAERTGAISRGHSVAVHEEAGVPVYTLIGGKLTTCRAFAEEVADGIFQRMHIERMESTRGRPFPGGRDYPPTAEELEQKQQELADRLHVTLGCVRAVWALCGNRVEQIAAEAGGFSGETLAGTSLPMAYVRWAIENEWVSRLDDLIERRLMLLYQRGVSLQSLRQLADCFADCGRLPPDQIDPEIERIRLRLQDQYGKRVG